MKKQTPGLMSALQGMWPQTANIEVPARVARSIASNDNNSEVLVKIIQFTIFAVWGVAFYFSPQPDPNTTSLVPIIIGLYLLFTVIGLVAALGKNPPNWLIYPSIALDMILLTYLIWSFHTQYQQPASFSLKAVEVMNFFVLIGLRSLRFQARYVLAAGLFAVLCWSALVGYVIQTDPADPMITRDYVTYLTSNTVLIGAEISKMISIVMFTIILAVAVRRAQYFLFSSVAEQSAARDLSRFMETSIAEHIRGAEQQLEAGEGVRREVAVLNIDIRGFTNMVADMEASAAMALLSDYQHHVVPIVHRHNGVVDKFMGDGIMITFGAAFEDEQNCANGLRCIEDIVIEQKTWKGPVADLKINMALTEGPAIFGAVGDADRLEVTVIGASVNRSAKLEKQNKILQTTALAGKHCYQKALSQGYSPKFPVKEVETVLGDDTKSSQVMVIA